MEAANRLADVLARENAALKRMDFPAAIALVTAKEAALADLARDAASVPAGVRSPAVVALAQRLTGLAEENRTLLDRAIAVQTRIVGIIARAITPVQEGARYQHPNEPRAPHRAMAMALSQRV
jgi:hypothetical protein